MFMWLFLLFFGIGLVLTIAGFALDLPLLNLVGTIMIFFMGMGLLQDGITYQTGVEETYVYGNYFDDSHWDGYNTTAPLQADKEAFLFYTEETPVYDSYDDAGENRFGWLLMAMGALLFCLSLFRL